MNVKIWKKLSHATTALISIVAIPVFLSSSPLWARDVDELLTTPFVDPLHTRPDVLDKGVMLPGDTAPWQCKTSRDFSTPLSLNEAVDLALCNNAQVKMAWATI